MKREQISAAPARRLTWLQRLLLISCLLTLGFTAPLWWNTRAYPVLLVAPWFPILPYPWDRCLFGGALVLLILAFWRYRSGASGFLVISLLLVLQDQNRLQPWFYLYWVLLLLSLLPPPAALAGCRLAFSAVYCWAGFHKCNESFYREVIPFFMGALSAWVPVWLVPLAQLGFSITPILEVFIGLGLWVPGGRRPALSVIVALHCIVLLALGPWGRNFNAVVWLWNLVMPALAVLLFAGGAPESPWIPLLRHAWGALVVAAFALLPVLSRYGWWDSYLSFSLYSGQTDRATILVSPALKERLPASIQCFIASDSPTAIQRPLQFDFRNWAESEIKVPCIPEKRAYLAVARHLSAWAVRPDDVRMILEERNGKHSIILPTSHLH